MMTQPRLRAIRKGLFLLGICLTAKIAYAVDQDTGREVYVKWCSACHMDSPFAPGTIRLKHSRGEELAVLEKRTDLQAAYIRILVRKGLNGMPLFRKTEISDGELEALVTYLAFDK